MKRIIALIVLICCCCVYSAYSLVQPLSLTRTTGSSSTPSQQTSLPMYAPPPSNAEPTCYCSSDLNDGTSDIIGGCFFCLNYDGYENDLLTDSNPPAFTNGEYCYKSQKANLACESNNSEPLCDHEHKFYAEIAGYYGYDSLEDVEATKLKCCYYMHKENYEYGDINAIIVDDNGITIDPDYSPWLYFCEADPTQCEWKIKHPNNQSLQLYNSGAINSYLNKIKDFAGEFPTEGGDIHCRISAGDEEPIDDVRIFYADSSLPSCDDDYSPYETSEYSSSCKISIASYNNDNDGSGGERGITKEYLLGYQKQPEEPAIPDCSSIFENDIISLLSSDVNCALSHETKLCVYEGVTKYYCSAMAGGAYCPDDFRLYYDGTYTETCPVKTKDYSPAVGYKKPEEEAVPPEDGVACSTVLNPEGTNTQSVNGFYTHNDTRSCGDFLKANCNTYTNGDTSIKDLCYATNSVADELPPCTGSVYTDTNLSGEYTRYPSSDFSVPCKTNISYGGEDNWHWTLVGFMSNDCSNIFPNDIIALLSDDDNVKCSDVLDETRKYCWDNNKKKYYCDVGSAVLLDCKNEAELYHKYPFENSCIFKQYEYPSGNWGAIGGFEVDEGESCPTKIQTLKDSGYLYSTEYDSEDILSGIDTEKCYDDENLEEKTLYPVCMTQQTCYQTYNGDFSNSCTYPDSQDFGTCKCPDDMMTIEEYRDLKGYTDPDTTITSNDIACTADGAEKFRNFNVVLGIGDYPSCQNIIDYQNALGDQNEPKDGYYDYCNNNEGIKCNNNGTEAFVCRYCGADNNDENGYNFEKSFKIDSETAPCPQGCHEDYACSYTKTDDTTITYCSQCNCRGYASKLELCSVGFEGEENNPEIMASPCYSEGIVDENESCKLDPNDDNPLSTMYKKILCPADYVTLEDWLGTSQTIITDNKFLENNLNISNENQWIKYFVPQTDEGSVCDYAVEVVESDSGGTDVDSGNEDTNDPENRSYSGGSDNLEGYEIKSLEPKYEGFNLSCQALLETLPNLEFINQAYLHNYNYHTTCWDIEGNQEKYLATCHEDYLLPEEGYEVIGNEDVCKFNGKDYYKYGGSCPVIFSGKEAVVVEGMSDDTIRNLYGSVKISSCNDNGTKKKVTYCDPNIYNQICEYPYVYASIPAKKWCLRNVQGKAVNPDPDESENNVKYYTNTGLPIQCKYDPYSCDYILQNDSNTNDVFIENSPNDCIKKYGTAVQTKLCNGEYNIPKYACYYPKDTYKWTTRNCPIGRDLSRPYILIDGVKYWDRCDCPPAYKYHVNNCRVYDLGGDTCEQEIDSHFIDTANDPTLPQSGIIKLYTKCNDPQINQPNGCKTPLGTWAKCYYCCPKGTRATGNLSIDSCGAKIYECK